MVAQAADVVHKFCSDILLEFLGQVVNSAGEHKVLPDQQAQFVTDIIEEVVGVIAAAPDPDAVHVGSPGILQQPAGPLGIYSGQQVVLGDVVGTHGEDIDAVDTVGEGFTPFILAAADRHGAKTDAPLPFIQTVAQNNTDRIEGLFAVAGGPPQLRFFDFDGNFASFGGPGFSAGSGNGDRNRGAAGNFRHMGVYIQRDLAVFVVLKNVNVPDPGCLDADDADVSPDAGVGQPGTPVPAVHAMGFADMGKAHHGIGGAISAGSCVSFLDIFGRRGEVDTDGILARVQQLLDIEFPDAVHIVGEARRGTVNGNSRDGVKPLAAQQHGIAAQQLLVYRKAAAVEKIVVHQLQGIHFVIPVEGIGNQLSIQQIMVYRAGDPGGDGVENAPGNFQRPGSV